jgi:hypothetical protein
LTQKAKASVLWLLSQEPNKRSARFDPYLPDGILYVDDDEYVICSNLIYYRAQDKTLVWNNEMTQALYELRAKYFKSKPDECYKAMIHFFEKWKAEDKSDKREEVEVNPLGPALKN